MAVDKRVRMIMSEIEEEMERLPRQLRPEANDFEPSHVLEWEEFAGDYGAANFIAPSGLLTFTGTWKAYRWWWSSENAQNPYPPIRKHCAALLFHTSKLLNPVLFISGGLDPDLKTSSQCLQAWASLDFGFRSSRVENMAAMLEPRFLHSLVQVNEDIYAIGGQQRNRSNTQKYLNSCEVLRDAGNYCSLHWDTAAPMNRPRSTLSVTCLKGVIYAFGGFAGPGTLAGDIEVYDPTRHVWNILVLKQKILAAVSVVHNADELWVLGGSDGYTQSNQILVFRPEEGYLDVLKNEGETVVLNEVKAKAVAVRIDEQVYVVGSSLERIPRTTCLALPAEVHSAICSFTG